MFCQKCDSAGTLFIVVETEGCVPKTAYTGSD